MKRVILSSYAMSCAVVLLASAVTICAAAQKTEADIKARLVNQPLYLRGQWNEDKLVFDDAGHLQENTGVASFTLSGVVIESVKLSPKELVLDGERVGLEFTKDVPKRVLLRVSGRFGGTSPEKMTIRIQAPPDGDFTAALNAVFVDSMADLRLPMPDCWQPFVRQHLLPGADPAAGSPLPGSGPAPSSPAASKVSKVDREVIQPQILKQEEPEFSASARALKYQGIVLVSLIVRQDGTATQVRILRPAGLGLDERAVAAVSRYVFKPAMNAGNPVPVMLNVEVNFQIF